MNKIAIILCGGSGVGKTTQEKGYISEYGFTQLISDTTRKIRDGEVDGVDYNFITIEEFKKRESEDKYFNVIDITNDWKYGVGEDNITSDKLIYSVIDVEYAINVRNELILNDFEVIMVTLDAEKEERLEKMNDRNENENDREIRLNREKKISTCERFHQECIIPDFSFKGLGKTKYEYVYKVMKNLNL